MKVLFLQTRWVYDDFAFEVLQVTALVLGTVWEVASVLPSALVFACVNPVAGFVQVSADISAFVPEFVHVVGFVPLIFVFLL